MVPHLPAPEIAVVYLAFVPYGTEPIETFLASYREYPAGLDHELVVLLKGRGKAPVEGLRVPNNCLDLGTYLWAARKIKAKRFLFLNTSSVILCDGWLRKLDRHLGGGVGIVGATGSYGNSKDGSRARRPRHPHIRTNAFMLERELMLDLDWQEPIETKERAFAVEHGERSITTQVRGRGLEALVVGRDGRAFPVDHWEESNTFWASEQENLLIADNATRKWETVSNGHHRRVLRRFAWA